MSTHASDRRLVAVVRGRVQGVGFRWWVARQASDLGLVGSAVNQPDGTVKVVAEGPEPACRALLDALRSGRTPGHVRSVAERWSDPTGRYSAFGTG